MSRRSQIRKMKISEEDRAKLRTRIRQTKDRKIADRLRVVWFKSEGQKHSTIAHLLHLSLNTVTDCLKRYLRGGRDAVCALQYQGKQPMLNAEQQDVVKLELKTQIYHTAQQVIGFVERQWGISYSVRGMQHLLRRLGLSYTKNRLVPSKADPEAQRQFVQWFQQVRAGLGPHDRLYFSDAVHVKHNAEAGYAWSEVGAPPQIPSNSGRQRYNVLGAYCTQTYEHVFLLTEENIRQDWVMKLLTQLRAKHPGQGTIYLILDNARYNHAKRVKEQAKAQGMTLKYLPPYSPNLNLIERLWKFMRKTLFKDKCRSTFAVFKQHVEEFFAHLDRYHDELVT